MKNKLVIGTRGSKLALWQANYIAHRLCQYHPGLEVTIKHIVTTGDKILDVPLAKIGGKGVFTKEIELAMLRGEIDLAVHSLKDMPTELPPGLTLAAITEREEPFDALISPKYGTLDKLPHGAKVGTSSLRRRAQLLNCRPDLTVCDLRGNVDTRLRKLETEELDAIVLAQAGLKRLGWDDRITQQLPPDICLPAVGQGALALETRSDDSEVLALVAFLHDEDTAAAVTAERSFLNELEGGCQVPIGVYGRVENGELVLDAAILSLDGAAALKDRICGAPAAAEDLGRKLAQHMYVTGGREILAGLFARPSAGGGNNR
ncbi:porphobilinogen deaminase [Thermosinus carboxydivorans Nor1]|uniref:Porphobilinogen deaminase n=1 Tax=Thermosinus carboxydivorans Nor1 TaxID=401526 RepID=A1HSI4_9FIRM|nr:hydroxymethylbilane synthase [Thermosinus carboxydivorans]EAX47047.1 porphobilinogen deaminase [Thermosinus carboxydivorans Nor1]